MANHRITACEIQRRLRREGLHRHVRELSETDGGLCLQLVAGLDPGTREQVYRAAGVRILVPERLRLPKREPERLAPAPRRREGSAA